MFVMMADVRIRGGSEESFERWFAESNRELAGSPGLVSRRLFRPHDGGYRIVVEHESKETFVAMHNSPAHDRVFPEGRSYMEGDPARRTFSAVIQ